jgi:hypothetical protein
LTRSTAASNIRRALAAALVLGLLAGCASTPKTPEEAVRLRAQERWNAYLAGDFKKAYGYLSPGSRAIVPYERWRAMAGGAVAWKSAEVMSVTCETSEKCTALLKVSYEPALMRGKVGSIERGLEETWLLDSGRWWLLQQ